LFDPKDGQHGRCARILKTVREPLRTTVPVLTEVFHMLGTESIGSDRVRDFVARGGLPVWFLDDNSLTRAFELMEQHSDHPMDLADASLAAAAQSLGTRKVFAVDRDDFATCRVRRGHRQHGFDVIG